MKKINNRRSFLFIVPFVVCLSVCVFLKTTSLFLFFRLYKNLPEVKAKNEEKKRLAFYRTNRLRAQLYDKVGSR